MTEAEIVREMLRVCAPALTSPTAVWLLTGVYHEENGMPSKSKKQERTMRAAAHDKEFAERMDIPQSVAREFVKADQAKKGRKRSKK